MEKTRVTVTSEGAKTFAGDLLVDCLVQPREGMIRGSGAISGILRRACELGDFKAKEKEALLLYPETKTGADGLSVGRVLIVGLGKESKEVLTHTKKERLRQAGGTIATKARKTKAGRVMLLLPEIPGLSAAQVASALVEGLLLGDYQFTKYKKKKEDEDDFEGIEEVILSSQADQKEIREGVTLAQQAARAGCRARDMANEPGNGWMPAAFARYGQEIARRYDMKCTILEKEEMGRLGMGGILGVNQGSAEPPKMVILDYEPAAKPSQTLLFVGKGLTFDSGGISMKPSAGMEEMKYDMCGGAAVLSAMEAIGARKPDMRIIGIVPATDNMVSGSAQKPGDIIRHVNGITSEVVNTDAEGRLILADALAYGVKTYQPDCVIDLATLTGAVIIGLGHHHTGLLSNNDQLVERLVAAGRETGEPLWRLPLTDDYRDQLKSEVADVKNVGGRPAGTITAAAYLEKFVDDTPWAHLDIAGTAWGFTKKNYIPKGPSGIGARTLLELVRCWQSPLVEEVD